MTMFDLRKLQTYYLEKYGRERIAELLDQKQPVIAMWEKSGKFPVDALQKMLEHDPEPLSEVRPLYENPPTGTRLAILMPLIGPPEPKTLDCLMRLYDRREMGFQRMAFNNLSVSRNYLAAWALQRGFEWFFWHDGDMLHPCGDAAYFKKAAGLPILPDVFAGVNTIYRLLSHRVKSGRTDATIVSICYVSRSEKATPQFGGGELPTERGEVRRGPFDALREKPWVGFGGVLTHRSVFEDIIRTQGDEIRMKPNGIGARFGYEYGFFDPLDRETPGDDVPFCSRAIRAGHKIFVDMAVHSAHIGDRAFTFRDV